MVQLKVNEIFVSIQGEGQHTGTPAVFIRLMGCPHNCVWCDTAHTWNPLSKYQVPFENLISKDYARQWSNATPDQIVETAHKLCADAKYRIPHVVITGGEPLIQIAGFSKLLPKLYEIGAQTIQMETSGYGPIAADELSWLRWAANKRYNKLHITCSPKREIEKPFFDLVSEWKLIVEEPVNDHTFIMMGQLQSYMHPAVYLQPCHYDGDEAKSFAALQSAIKYCKQYGYKLSLQTHKLIGVR